MQTSNDMVVYEYPLNEKVRLWLRFNRLFEKFTAVLSSCASLSPLDSYWDIFALKILFEMIEIAEQSDLRAELVIELDRFQQFIKTLHHREEIDQSELEKLMKRLSKVMTELRAAGRPNYALNSNPWLSALRGRMVLSGGYNDFDIPSLHWWRNRSNDRIKQDLSDFQQEFYPVEMAMKMMLDNIRVTSDTQSLSMTCGNIILNDIRNLDVVLLRLLLPVDCTYFPEFSANRYQVNIRMLELSRDSWETHKAEPSGYIEIQRCVIPGVSA